MDALETGENEKPEDAARRLDTELGVSQWWTPISLRRPESAKPRVTEDGLKMPSWWTDEETESQQWLAAQGVVL